MHWSKAMNNKIVKRKVLFGVILLCLLSLCACGKQTAPEERLDVYKYDNPDFGYNFCLKKTIFGETFTSLYFEHTIDSNMHIYAYAEDGTKIDDKDIEIEIDRQRVTVRGKYSTTLNQLHLSDGYSDYDATLGDFKSNQFKYMYVSYDSEGGSDISGDILYFIPDYEEKQQEVRDVYYEKFSYLEGEWTNEDSKLVFTYYAEQGYGTMEYYSGDTKLQSIDFCNFVIEEADGIYIKAEYWNDPWTSFVNFVISEDGKTITYINENEELEFYR